MICTALSLPAAPHQAGPRGGRLLESQPHPAEFFVTPERKVEITFYDAALQPMTPPTESVVVTAEAPSGRIRLEF